MLFYLVLTLILIYFLKIYHDVKVKYLYWKKKGVKTLPPMFPFGNLMEIFILKSGFNDTLYKWHRTVDEKILGLYAIDEPFLLIRDPDIIKAILVKDFNSFSDRGTYYNKRQLSSGLLFKIPTKEWKPLRAKMTPCFTLNKIKNMMFQHLIETGAEMENYLEEETIVHDVIDISDISQRYAVDFIASSIFGLKINSFKEKNNEYFLVAEDLFRSDSKMRTFFAAMQILAPRFYEIFHFINFPTIKESTSNFIANMVQEVVNFREKTGTERSDLMQLLIQLKNNLSLDDDKDNKEKGRLSDDGKKLTMAEVVAQAYTFFLLGSDTTTATLRFLFYECAQNTDIQQLLHQDIDACLKKTDGKITYEAISDMKYLWMVIFETLRKYSNPGFLARQAVKNYKIPDMDLVIEKGTRIYISTLALQNDPKFYPEPEKFDPERFSSGNLEGFTSPYMPFGDGPRNCIAKRLGQFMVAVGAVSILRNFNINFCTKTPSSLTINHLSYTTQPKEKIFLKITKRK